MAKIYSEKSSTIKKLKPTKETISFILNFSKAYSSVKAKGVTIDLIAN